MIRSSLFLVLFFIAAILSAQITERDMRQSRSAFSEGIRKGVDSDFAGAHELFDKAIRLDSLYSEAYLYRGLARIELMMFEKALEDFRRIINLDRDISSQANYFSGIALLAIDRYRDALIHFNEAVRLNPDFSSFFHRGKAFFYLERYEQALQDFEISDRLNPDLPEVHYYLGKTNAIQGNYNAALDYLLHAKDSFSDNPEFHYFFGSVLMQLNHAEEATIHLDIAENAFGTRLKPLETKDTINDDLDEDTPEQPAEIDITEQDPSIPNDISEEPDHPELTKGFYNVELKPFLPRGLGVQLGSYANLGEIKEKAAGYQRQFGHPAVIEVAMVNDQVRYRIIIGIFESREEALVLRSRLRDQGFLDSFIVRYP